MNHVYTVSSAGKMLRACDKGNCGLANVMIWPKQNFRNNVHITGIICTSMKSVSQGICKSVSICCAANPQNSETYLDLVSTEY